MRRNLPETRFARTRAVASVLALMLTLGACGWFHRPGHSVGFLDREASGRELYLSACASCHGAGGTGDGPVAVALVTRPPDLTKIAADRGGTFNAAEIREIVDGRVEVGAHGPREMPVWGREFSRQRTPGEGREALPRDLTRRIVDYLESIQH